MEFEQFIEKVKNAVTDFMGGEVTVEKREVLKNNGVLLKGLLIKEGENNCIPNIYLNEYYEQFLQGKPIHDIVYEITLVYEKYKVQCHVDMDFFTKYENVRTRILYKIINLSENDEMLADIPHIPFLDLAIVFYCNFYREEFGDGSIMIHNDHLKKWNITMEELLLDAKKNTPRLLQSEIISMEEVIGEMLRGNMKQEIEKCIEEQIDRDIMITDDMMEPIIDEMLREIAVETGGPSMYIMSNKTRTFGAATLLYDKVLSDFAKKLKADLYILPSSVHEMILIPVTDDHEPERLKAMVKEVNETQVDAEEVLSNSVYCFERKTGEITLVS